MGELIEHNSATAVVEQPSFRLPAIIVPTGANGAERFLNYFAAEIENDNTRAAYLRVWARFSTWCDDNGIDDIRKLKPINVATYLKSFRKVLAKSTIKQHRAALSKCCDYLVVGQIIPENPVAAVRGPKVVVKKGKTPVLTDDEFLDLMDSIPTDNLVGLRDRALIALLAYAWPRISAAVGLNVGDYFPKGKRWYVALHEKGGKEDDVIVHHQAQDELDAYLQAAGILDDRGQPIFRSFDRQRRLTRRRLHRREALAMVKRRARRGGLNWYKVCNHSFRATGLTNYMSNGGRIDVAQEVAGHADPRTTGMYDHSSDKVTQSEIEKIRFEREC